MSNSEDGRVVQSAALWGTILNIGGVFLVTSSLGYAALTLQAYEDQCGSVAACARGNPTEAAASQETAQDVNMVDVLEQAGPSPNTPDPSTTAQLQQLVTELDAARGRLADADATNAALRKRVAELEQQAAAQGESASGATAQAAQCRSELAGIHQRYGQAIDKIRANAERTEQALNACRQQVGQPITN